ncbi:MAG TPA: YciI family protein [Pseudolysinimonas sp.]|nr:YciI family protein [Pseudolysinimonas sp.]
MLFVMTAEFLGQPDDELLAAHIAWLVPQFERGTFVISGGVEGVGNIPPSALAVMEAGSREEALAVLDDEPFFRAGKVRHEVRPYEIRVASSGLDARLPGAGTRVVSTSGSGG